MNIIPLYIGCYTDAPSASEGLYQVLLDTDTGMLSSLSLIHTDRNPSFVASTAAGVYLISEVDHAASPSLSFISKLRSGRPNSTAQISGDHPCHISIAASGKYAITSQYSSGSYDIFALNINGTIDSHLSTIFQNGSGPNKDRQTGPHAHQAVFLKHVPHFVTVDLGADTLTFYCFDDEQDEFLQQPIQQLCVPKGNGPRHLVFNQEETHAYVVCELSETILVLEKALGQWEIVQEVAALPNEEKGEAAAAIKLSSDGRFLYVSCRHQSKISCFSVNAQDKRVQFSSSCSTQGEFPRDFYITEDDKWIVVANQHSNNLTTFKRNRESGELTYSGHSILIDAPVCVTASR